MLKARTGVPGEVVTLTTNARLLAVAWLTAVGTAKAGACRTFRAPRSGMSPRVARSATSVVSPKSHWLC